MSSTRPERTSLIRRATSRLCRQLNWVLLHEVTFVSGRRADIFAMAPDGAFICIEIKSSLEDFGVDLKWPDYRAFCDELWFAVDADFPQSVLPSETGLIVTAGLEAAMIRPAPRHPLAPARRRALLTRFARLAAARLEQMADPMASFGTSPE